MNIPIYLNPMRLALSLPPVLALLCGPYHAPRAQEGPEPTPEAAAYEIAEDPKSGVSFVALAAPLQSGARVGFAFICTPGVAPELEIHFGGWPARPTWLQLAVKRPDGAAWRHGEPERRQGGPDTGFAYYRLTDPESAAAFLDAAARPGALISNGYNSVWNRTSIEDSNAARSAISRCGGVALEALGQQ